MQEDLQLDHDTGGIRKRESGLPEMQEQEGRAKGCIVFHGDLEEKLRRTVASG
jgi:hypothetical protein